MKNEVTQVQFFREVSALLLDNMPHLTGNSRHILRQVNESASGKVGGYKVHGLSAESEIDFGINAIINVSLAIEGKKMVPHLTVGWSALNRSALEARVACDLHQKVSEFACKLHVLLTEYEINPNR
jgi:hypothetical protein